METNLGLQDAESPGWCHALPKKSLHCTCRMSKCIVLIKLICSLGHCECDCHTVHKLSSRRLTADWLAPRECNCSRMNRKVSSDWLPNYNKATRTVLGIFKMAWYFSDKPRVWNSVNFATWFFCTVNKMLDFWRRNYFFLILAHPVYKMWTIQEPNTLELWNKLHYEEKETESIHHV